MGDRFTILLNKLASGRNCNGRRENLFIVALSLYSKFYMNLCSWSSSIQLFLSAARVKKVYMFNSS